MSDSCCRKKQTEKQSDGTSIDRCVNPKSQVFLNVVSNHICGLCPVKAACQKPKPEYVPGPDLPGYPYCENRVLKDMQTICSVTGLPVTVEQCNNCDAETRDRVATLGDKLVGYAGAIRRWVAAGRPTRTEEEIKSIFEDHCNKCEMFDREKHSCKNCGCSLAQTGNPLTNKLAMKTESCPLGRW
jgi:hypothetical protein